MFVWGVLKRGIPESVRFCIGDLLMYIFLYRPIPNKEKQRTKMVKKTFDPKLRVEGQCLTKIFRPPIPIMVFTSQTFRTNNNRHKQNL